MDILGFIITLLPIIISPGASFTIALDNTLTYGIKGLLITIIGTALGIITHGLLVGLGITKLLVSSPSAFMVLTILGNLYLIYLGISLIRSGLKASKNTTIIHQKVSIKTAYIANVLNPKAIMLYLVVVSSYAGATPTLGNYLALSSIHIFMMSIWLIACCGFILLSSQKINIVIMKKVINISGGTLLLILTATPYIKHYISTL
ncbi:LysE family translocator [Proteus sp. WDL240414]|uniref:LysE family translocator n=2 Tax=Proteus TaxID=583 RepID=A0A6I7D8N5_9GAMM|nr:MULTISPECIES: LysE family translocator [Proteus]MBG2802610.1 LysE family translocator [Proteus mirabilis]MBG3019311.1 LysE family translocator [Proteus mirabilis]MBG3150427.1 LysE family translocator [Proteus mirabilis]QHN10322.1 LysE family translocator [Proteus columbae]